MIPATARIAPGIARALQSRPCRGGCAMRPTHAVVWTDGEAVRHWPRCAAHVEPLASMLRAQFPDAGVTVVALDPEAGP